MLIQPEKRPIVERHGPSSAFIFLIVTAAAALGAAGFVGWWNLSKVTNVTDLPTQQALDHYNISDLPIEAIITNNISMPLKTLAREKCDWPALYTLAVSLQDMGYQRPAAVALTAYSDKCRTASTALRLAADIFGSIADYPLALETAEKLIDSSSTSPDNYYLLGQLALEAKDYRRAVDAITSTISLTEDLSTLNSGVFSRLADAYSEQGEYCQAASTIETWISISSDHNTAASNSLLDRYTNKGSCGSSYASGEDNFPISSPDVIWVEVEISGKTGKFIVDTGASSVVLTHDFASLAGLAFDEQSIVKMQTANGFSTAHRMTIPNLIVGKTSAANVPAMVMDVNSGGLGGDTDGLLGRSFLARFEVVFTSKQWILRPKTLSAEP